MLAYSGLYRFQKPSKNCCEWLHSFFDISLVKETLMVAFKRGPNNRRLRVIMLVVVLCVVIGPIYGEMSVMYLFTRYRFNWNEVDFSVFSTYAMCTSLVGTLFSVGVFSHLLKFDDAIIGVISCTSKILSGFMYAFATKTWHIYIGKVNSFFGVAEAMMPLVYAPMYTTMYTATIKTFPGAFFLLGGGLTVPAVLIFLWLYLASRKYDGKVAETKTVAKEKEANAENTPTKTGVDNKAFESDKDGTNTTDNVTNSMPADKENMNQSQIEMGLTESMRCTSKL
ncbi:hypothetical protein MSG28_008008 [Choristoneura fumiferana]|uniref:Uncharacterized protein n=1 Tax=Choristoneura fumiferana TaxID=7141 RepID=A0ACC0J9J4_CHOFU|nr:hypothetical protein MSG28_008008 [Choristoneura fumiferana]